MEEFASKNEKRMERGKSIGINKNDIVIKNISGVGKRKEERKGESEKIIDWNRYYLLRAAVCGGHPEDQRAHPEGFHWFLLREER